MPVTAVPLSTLFTVKGAVDQVRSVVGEYDNQIVTDDQIKGYLQDAIMGIHQMFPKVRREYTIQIPFVADTTAVPLVSTLPRASATFKYPIKVEVVPAGNVTANPTLLASPDDRSWPMVSSGFYDFHYEAPTNCSVLDWTSLFNTLNGSCKRTTDFDQLVGICLGGNTQLARTVCWFNKGRHLWVSVREGMLQIRQGDETELLIIGHAIRTVIPIIELQASTVETGNSDHAPSLLDESFRYVPLVNDYDMFDAPDDYAPLVIRMAAIRVWGQKGQTPQESVEASVNTALAQLTASMDNSLKQGEVFDKENQYR